MSSASFPPAPPRRRRVKFPFSNVSGVALSPFPCVSFRFATREPNGLLLYNGRFNEKHDFIAMEIIEEQIQLTYSAGRAVLTAADSESRSLRLC